MPDIPVPASLQALRDSPLFAELQRATAHMLRIRNRWLQRYITAWVMVTGVDPADAMLVETHDTEGNKVTYTVRIVRRSEFDPLDMPEMMWLLKKLALRPCDFIDPAAHDAIPETCPGPPPSVRPPNAYGFGDVCLTCRTRVLLKRSAAASGSSPADPPASSPPR